MDDLDHQPQIARQLVHDAGLSQRGQYLLMVKGFHSDPDMSTPTITLLKA